MGTDFKKICKMEDEIKTFLEAHPEHSDWFYAMRAEIDRQAGKDPHNRCAVATNIMIDKWMEIIPATKDLK